MGHFDIFSVSRKIIAIFFVNHQLSAAWAAKKWWSTCHYTRRIDIYRSLIMHEIIVLFHNRDVHDPSSRCTSTIVNGRTDPFACHCLLDTCHPYFLQSIGRWLIRRRARPHKSCGKDLSRPSIVYNGLNDLDFILRLEPQTARTIDLARTRGTRRRTSAHYSRRIDRACERSWLPSLRIRCFYTF